jgi:hypothetical protein
MDYPYQFTLDGEVFPYDESITDCDEEGEYDYLYDISVVWKNRDGVVTVSRWGVSLWYDDGDALMTNIQPHSLFPNKRKLSVDDLKRIVKTLEDTKVEGMPVSKEQMDSFYQRYLRETTDDTLS